MDKPNLQSPQEERGETDTERADRNFAEVVQELRVAQTGVQILFAFLLSVAFMNLFPADDEVFKWVLAAALLSSAGAAICFIAPVATHRLHFRQGRKEGVVQFAHWMSMVGLVLLVVAMTLAVWLVIAQMWSTAAANWVAVGMVVVVVVLWLVVPISLLGRPSTDIRPTAGS